MTQQLESTPAPSTAASGNHAAPVRWQRTPEVELLGPLQDSGLKDDTFLIRRGDGQMVQVSGLLHTVLREIDPGRTPEQIADAVSSAYGKRLDAGGLSYLVTKYLTVLGLVEIVGAPKAAEPPPRARTIMSLTARATLMPARVVRPVSRVLSPLYHPVVVAVALGAWVGLGIALVMRGDLAHSLGEVLRTPLLLLAMTIALGACAIVHELGHATATTRGGAKPGRIGVGIYIVFLAYFTDVSDSYRLNRAGRIRVDLGGLYFNILTAIGLGVGYMLTGSGFLLLMIVVLHIQMSQQLLPTGRFDGYYLLGDISGVPDLFARAKPALLSLLPRGDKSGVADLKPWVRVVVLVWAVVVIPLLVFMLGFLLWSLPTLLRTTWAAGTLQAERLLDAAARSDAIVAILSVLSIIMLALPLIGITVILWRIASSLVRWAWNSWRSAPVSPSPPRLATTPTASGSPRTAEEFTDELMLTFLENRNLPMAAGPRRRGQDSSPADRPEQSEELLARLHTPITGTRRVVVMSRKGGVGKTTVTMALGHTYSATRGDRVIAVDANPDAGNLAHRVAPAGPHTITDVLREIDSITSYAELRGYTAQSPESHLEVLAADDDPRIASALGQSDYDQLIELLDRYYNLILLDTGTGILDSAHQGLLPGADQLVIVLRAGIDSGRAAALTLDWLEAQGYDRLVASAVVVVNGVSPQVGAPVEPMAAHFAQRCAKVITVPWDPELEVGGRTTVAALQPETRAAFEEMAAAVAELFDQPGRSPKWAGLPVTPPDVIVPRSGSAEGGSIDQTSVSPRAAGSVAADR